MYITLSLPHPIFLRISLKKKVKKWQCKSNLLFASFAAWPAWKHLGKCTAAVIPLPNMCVCVTFSNSSMCKLLLSLPGFRALFLKGRGFCLLISLNVFVCFSYIILLLSALLVFAVN